MAEHGTNAGYQAHRKLGEDACDPCRAAARAYQAAYRAAHRERRAHNATRNAARGRAMRRLVARHPEEFRELYEKEKARLGHDR